MAEKEKDAQKLNMKTIKKIIAMMGKQGLTELDIEQDGMKVHLKRGVPGSSNTPVAVVTQPVAAPVPVQPAAVPAASAASAPEAPPKGDEGLVTVTSPMVGTFYTSPGPDAAPFTKPGDVVKEGQTLCIIEAMKLMNEIKSET